MVIFCVTDLAVVFFFLCVTSLVSGLRAWLLTKRAPRLWSPKCREPIWCGIIFDWRGGVCCCRACVLCVFCARVVRVWWWWYSSDRMLCHLSCFMFHVSCVMCRVSCVVAVCGQEGWQRAALDRGPQIRRRQRLGGQNAAQNRLHGKPHARGCDGMRWVAKCVSGNDGIG